MPKEAAVVQSAPADPRFLFSPENFTERSFLGEKIAPIVGVSTGFVAAVAHNFSKRRPYFSNLPFVIGATALGLGGGIWFQNRSDNYWAERDAIYRHYIDLHPEDFPVKERILVGDMLKPWVPIR